jgi:hypothetical protein
MKKCAAFLCLQFRFFWQLVSDDKNNWRDYQKPLTFAINSTASKQGATTVDQ